MLCALLALAVIPLIGLNAQAGNCKLKIGATLHPYYSWVKNIVGDTAEVSTVIPPNADPHTYQPMPDDLKNLQNLDVLIVNWIGHDEFIKPMLKATEHKNLKVIYTAKGLPLLMAWGKHFNFDASDKGKVVYNSHTYIGITIAIQQIQMIARELGKICPEKALFYKKNARAYSKRLRKMLAAALDKLDKLDLNTLRIATVHDGYAYLFQDLGIETAAVVQPRHGIEPNARQLQDTIRRVKRARVNVLFTEADYAKKYTDIITEETGCRLYKLSHISHGKYTADTFEKDMQFNLDEIVKAFTVASRDKKK